MFSYFWNVAETCSSMVLLYLRLAETWKFKSAWLRHVSGTEMPSHVSVIFKPADFRCCSFPSCFCKRICSCLLHLPKHKREMVLWTTMNLNILTSRRRATAATPGSTSPHTSQNDKYKAVWGVRIHNIYEMISWRIYGPLCLRTVQWSVYVCSLIPMYTSSYEVSG